MQTIYTIREYFIFDFAKLRLIGVIMINTNLTKQEIIERLSYFRTQKNISAYKLGKDLGHAKTYFYRIESGEINLTLENFLDCLQILGVTTSEFFCPTLKQENIDILKKLDNLSLENKSTIINLIDNLK